MLNAFPIYLATEDTFPRRTPEPDLIQQPDGRSTLTTWLRAVPLECRVRCCSGAKPEYLPRTRRCIHPRQPRCTPSQFQIASNRGRDFTLHAGPLSAKFLLGGVQCRVYRSYLFGVKLRLFACRFPSSRRLSGSSLSMGRSTAPPVQESGLAECFDKSRIQSWIQF
jgi:hypothetical protein